MNRKHAVVLSVAIAIGGCLVVPYALAQPWQDRPAADEPQDRTPGRPGPVVADQPGHDLDAIVRWQLASAEQPPPRQGGGERETPDTGPKTPEPRPGGRDTSRRPGMNRPFMRPPMEEAEVGRMQRHIELIGRMRATSFEPEMAGLVALGALRTDVRYAKPEDATKELETLLTQVKTLGLRNSIRLILKDLYREMGKNDKVLEQLRAVVLESDAELQREKASPKPAAGRL